MLANPEKQIVKDLASLSSDARFTRVCTWLLESADDLYDLLLVSEGITLHKTIGEVTILKDLLGRVSSSGVDLERFAQNESELLAP